MQTTFDFAKLSADAQQALNDEFPKSVLSVDEGWHGRAHIKIVSDAFNGKSESAKQELVWDVLKSKLGPEAQGVSLVLVYGLDEI